MKSDGKNILEEDGERGVLFRSWLGRESKGEFFLEEECAHRKKISIFHHHREKRRGDGVGKVADQLCLFFLNKIFEIDLKYISFENRQVGG